MKYKVGDILIQQWNDMYIITDIDNTYHRITWVEYNQVSDQDWGNDTLDRDTYIGPCKLISILYGIE